MTAISADGIVNMPSPHSVQETAEKFKSILETHGVDLFAVMDHSGGAEKIGLKMPPTQLLIFGSPESWYSAHAGFSECRD